jgi:hypothetical protein
MDLTHSKLFKLKKNDQNLNLIFTGIVPLSFDILLPSFNGTESGTPDATATAAAVANVI